MLKNWRAWVILALFLGPYLAFMGLGFLWLRDRGWLWVTVAAAISVTSGVVMSVLLARWTKLTRSLLPPIDWDAPQTFSEFDRQALALVEAEADRGEALEMAALTQLDTYIETGRGLATRLAAHYHPLSSDPIERVAVVELLAALELAAEDLAGLCRQVPGGDLVTPADWKKAVLAAGYIQKASDLYTYLLPLFNPVTGIPRLASQHLMVKPAWKNMQQNVLRWFYRAFVNRLGTHLIELYSGRLVIGADRYRQLTRKGKRPGTDPSATVEELTIAVAGSKHSGQSKLIEAIEQARHADPAALEGRIVALGGDRAGLERLRSARLVEVDHFSAFEVGQEHARGRSTRKHAVAEAAESDLLVVALDAVAGVGEADLAFLRDWVQWYHDHPGLEVPPALAVLTHVEALPTGTTLEIAMQAARAKLPATVSLVAAVSASGIEPVLPPLSILCHRAERNALIRQLRDASARSRAGRLIRQVGQQGRTLFQGLRDRRKPKGGDAA